jgi:hypothetical protein
MIYTAMGVRSLSKDVNRIKSKGCQPERGLKICRYIKEVLQETTTCSAHTVTFCQQAEDTQTILAFRASSRFYGRMNYSVYQKNNSPHNDRKLILSALKTILKPTILLSIHT